MWRADTGAARWPDRKLSIGRKTGVLGGAGPPQGKAQKLGIEAGNPPAYGEGSVP